MITNVTSTVDLPAAVNGRSQTDARSKNEHEPEEAHGSDFTLTSPTHRVALEQAVGKVREALEQSGSQLQIEVDQDLHRVVVKILNRDSGEVIRQIPPQEVIDLAKDLANHMSLLFEEYV